MDVARIIRLKSTIEAAAATKVAHWEAVDTYNRLRDEIAQALADAGEPGPEFERLYPHWDYQTNGARLMGRVVNSNQAATEAKARMTQIAGWLKGLVDAARVEAEIHAYAVERVKAERGIGFQAPTPTAPEQEQG